MERRDVDYSMWLGPDYRKQKKPLRSSTYISNHTGICDVFCYLWALGGDIGLYAGAFVLDIPLFRECVQASEGVFVPRKGDAETK